MPLTDEERAALGPATLLDDDGFATLEDWVRRHHRDTLVPTDLADPALWRESLAALDELTKILGLGTVYAFQRAGGDVVGHQVR